MFGRFCDSFDTLRYQAILHAAAEAELRSRAHTAGAGHEDSALAGRGTRRSCRKHHRDRRTHGMGAAPRSRLNLSARPETYFMYLEG